MVSNWGPRGPPKFNQIVIFSQLFAPRARNGPGVVPGSKKGRPRRPKGAKRLPKGSKKSWKRHPKGFHKASKCNKQVHWEFYRQFNKQCYCQCNRHCNRLPQPPTQHENKYPNRLVGRNRQFVTKWFLPWNQPASVYQILNENVHSFVYSATPANTR